MTALGIVASAHVETGSAPVTPTVEGSASIAQGSTASPSITFPTSPIENDIIIVFMLSANVADCQAVTGWINALGAEGTKIDPGSGQVTLTAAWHRVTAGEDTANQTVFTLTNWWIANELTNVAGIYLRGVNTTTPIDATGTASSDLSTTPHILAAVTGSNIGTTNGLVLRCIGQDSIGGYTTPTGHTQRQAVESATTSISLAVYTRDTAATAGVNVAAVNITPDAADQYASMTLVITPA